MSLMVQNDKSACCYIIGHTVVRIYKSLHTWYRFRLKTRFESTPIISWSWNSMTRVLCIRIYLLSVLCVLLYVQRRTFLATSHLHGFFISLIYKLFHRYSISTKFTALWLIRLQSVSIENTLWHEFTITFAISTWILNLIETLFEEL